MVQSTRGGRGGRVTMFELFTPRRSGPWVWLRPLFRGYGLVVPLALAGWVCVAWRWDPIPVAVVLAVLCIASFAIVWTVAGFLIRLRAVLLVLIVLGVTGWWLQQLTTPVWGSIILAVLMVTVCSIPASGRFLWVRAWCVLDRHRMRSCFRVAKVRTMNLDGALPFLLWAHPSKTGERVWLWIRVGSCADDIKDALAYLATACFAREARLHEVRKLTTVVAVDIIRRDPLSVGDKIPSPLSRLADMVTGSGSTWGEGTETIRAASVEEIIDGESSAVPLPRRRLPKGTRSVPREPATPSVVVAGEDLSDYVD